MRARARVTTLHANIEPGGGDGTLWEGSHGITGNKGEKETWSGRCYSAHFALFPAEQVMSPPMPRYVRLKRWEGRGDNGSNPGWTSGASTPMKGVRVGPRNYIERMAPPRSLSGSRRASQEVIMPFSILPPCRKRRWPMWDVAYRLHQTRSLICAACSRCVPSVSHLPMQTRNIRVTEYLLWNKLLGFGDRLGRSALVCLLAPGHSQQKN